MEAPDKIFLPRDIDWPSAAILTLGNQPGDVEYIRKDALLEKINKTAEIVNGIPDDGYKRGCQIIIDQVTDFIKSM